MFLHFLLLSARNFRKNIAQSFINVTSLVLGFTSCLAIGAYLYAELSYDQFHKNKHLIYRVNYDETTAEVQGLRHMATVAPPVGPAIKENFPAVKEFVRFRYADVHTLRVNDKQFYESNIYYADPAVFSVFTFEFLHGEHATALKEINAAVITREMAVKYFGKEDALGEVFTMDNITSWKVTGVLESLPENSHLKFGVLLPFEAFKVPTGYPVTLQDWGWISFHTYVMLREKADARELEARLPELVAKHFPPERVRKFRYRLQPLTDIYMGEVKHAQLPAGNTTYLYSLACAAILILIAASFNYMNLFTAQSISRAKEIGIRKVSGAGRRSISFQFLGESVLTSVTAMIISGVLLVMLRSLLSDFAEIRIDLQKSQYQVVFAIAALTALSVGLVAGLYPSLLLSSLDMGSVLKGNFKVNISGAGLRKGMVVLQFMICSMILTSVFVINGQLAYIRDKYLGFEKDELLLLRVNEEEMVRKYPLLRAQLLQLPAVEMVSVGGHRMDGNNGNVPIFVEGSEETGIPMSIDAVKHGYFKTTGIELVSGREFDERFPADSAHSVIINQAAAKVFGWKDNEALGKRIRVSAILTEGEVIGVVRDFHFGPLNHEIKPLVIYYPRTLLEDVYVRVRKGTSPAPLLASLEKIWSATVPDYPLEFTFLNDHIDRLYKGEEKFSKLFTLFSCIAIIIACLGLYGLVNQEIIYRVKEIGIRKVLGASVRGIFSLVAGKFIIQVMVASVVGFPLAWYFLKLWLNGFAYHVEITPAPFVLAGIITLMIAFLTVLNKALKASLANPVDSIKTE